MVKMTFLSMALLVAFSGTVLAGEKTAATYKIYLDDRPVLRVVDRPGTLASTAMPPPPGAEPNRHPFLSASALAPEEEDALRRILDASTSTLEFLKKLRQAGYEVLREQAAGK